MQNVRSRPVITGRLVGIIPHHAVLALAGHPRVCAAIQRLPAGLVSAKLRHHPENIQPCVTLPPLACRSFNLVRTSHYISGQRKDHRRRRTRSPAWSLQRKRHGPCHTRRGVFWLSGLFRVLLRACATAIRFPAQRCYQQGDPCGVHIRVPGGCGEHGVSHTQHHQSG